MGQMSKPEVNSMASRRRREPAWVVWTSWLLDIAAWLLLVALLGTWRSLPIGLKGEGLFFILLAWVFIRLALRLGLWVRTRFAGRTAAPPSWVARRVARRVRSIF